VADALVVAARKSGGPADELEVKVDPETGDIKAVAHVTVVPQIEDPATEMDIKTAQEVYPNCELGDLIEWDVDPNTFGRVAAQTYRQALISRLNQEEKLIACEEFRDRVGTIIMGEVKNFSRGEYIIDFGKVDGVMPRNEKIPSEQYRIGEHIAVYLKEIDEERPRACMVVSRSDARFVEQLFEREVSEIADELIEIKGIARDAGFRSKVAVHSTSSDIDPVGSCVGMRGSRVRAIVRELNGEKVDIVVWSDDLVTYVRNAMQPAELESVTIDEENHTIKIIAREDQYSLAIGKRGQNARLASKLLGWKIDINKEEVKSLESGFEEQLNKAVADLSSVDGIDEATAKKLVNAGFLSIAGLKAASADDLSNIDDIDEAAAQTIKAAVDGL
jgi:N utilization substance protein A